MAVADELLGDDRAAVGLVVLQVGADGAIPVDLARARSVGARGAIQAAAHRLEQRIRQLALQLLHHAAHHLPRGILRLLRDDVAQREQRRHQMHVRLDLLQHLRLQQHLRQVQALQRVLLHHPDGGRGEVGADVAEPARHVGRRLAQPAGALVVVERLQYAVHAQVLRRPAPDRPAPPTRRPARAASVAAVSVSTVCALMRRSLRVSAPAPAGQGRRARG